MKVLITWPPHIPFYFNLCYHYCDFGETVGYLKKFQKNEEYEMKVMDGGVLNLSFFDFIKELYEKPDVLLTINQFENLDSVRKLSEYSKEISPKTKVLTFGPVSSLIPRYFQRYKVDAIVHSGNWGLIIKKYLQHLKDKETIGDLNGLYIKSSNGWIETEQGEFLNPSEMGFPALDDLPLEDYFKIYEREENISGIKGKKELSFTVSSGCPIRCGDFCRIPKIYGKKDRRRETKQVLDFIEESFEKYPFDYVSLYSPTFTLKRNYVIDFCNEIKRRKMDFKWKCVTTTSHVDEKLLSIMGDTGCFRIGFGVESFGEGTQQNIKKGINEKRVKKVIDWCLNYKINPLCFIMVGVPGQTKEDIFNTVRKIKNWGGEIRPTAYTPYYMLKDDMSEEEVMSFDRLTISSDYVKGLTKDEFYGILLNQDLP